MKIRTNDICYTLFRLIATCIVACVLTSCHDDEVPEGPSLGGISTCYRDSSWDKESITNKLIGTWQWEYIACVWIHDQAQSVSDSNITIEFRADSILLVNQNDAILQTSSWELVEGGENIFSIEENPRVDQLFGRIFICGTRMVFNGSNTDGCDHFFIRVD